MSYSDRDEMRIRLEQQGEQYMKKQNSTGMHCESNVGQAMTRKCNQEQTGKGLSSTPQLVLAGGSTGDLSGNLNSSEPEMYHTTAVKTGNCSSS